MKALERPTYILVNKEASLAKGEEGRIRKQIKADPLLQKYWEKGHSTLPEPPFPNKECKVAYELGKRNAEAEWMDD